MVMFVCFGIGNGGMCYCLFVLVMLSWKVVVSFFQCFIQICNVIVVENVLDIVDKMFIIFGGLYVKLFDYCLCSSQLNCFGYFF